MALARSDITTVQVNTSSSGETTIVAAQAGKRIIVHSWGLVSAGAVSVSWKSGATTKYGPMPFAANGGMSVPGGIDDVAIACDIGEALIVNLGGAVQTGGGVSYSLEPR